MKTIVVGVDGSAAGESALDYAVGEAVEKKAKLLIVSAFTVPPLVVAGVAAEAGFFEAARSEAHEHAAAVASASVERARALASTLDCEEILVGGPPANAILEAAESAILIVVGREGHGGISGRLLGSVSQHIVQHAHCPVVVVPAP